MFVPNQKVVRRADEDKNKKWPDKYLDIPIRIETVSGDRIRFSAQDHPELVNPKGWVASRFISASDPRFNPLKRFL